MIFIIFSILLSLAFFVFSYLWVDFNLTLISWPAIAQVMDLFQHWGFFHRPVAAKIYLVLTILSFLPSFYFLFKKKIQFSKKRWFWIILPAILIVFAYPFLSHDIFNYLFDGRMIWFHRVNPYRHAPQEFSADHWTRFMHWVHKSTPYGPTQIFYSLIIAIAGFNKFLPSYLFIKIGNLILFLITGFYLIKILKSKRLAVSLWFLNPFLYQEFLINCHNDLLMIFLAVIGFYYWQKKKKKGWLAFLFSVTSKYVSILLLPAFIFKKHYKIILLGSSLVLLTGFVVKITSFQAWYFAWLLMMLPFLKLSRYFWSLVLGGELLILLVKYYPFLRLGQWQTKGYLFLQGYFIFLALVLIFDFFCDGGFIRLRRISRV